MIVIFDLEFTTWVGAQERGWSKPDEFREIVQIGALRVDPGTLAVDGEFEVLVRPVRNPRLSGFFQQLTGITEQAVAERGVSFAEALDGFLKFCDDAYTLSYGNDMVILGENLILQLPPDGEPAGPLPPFLNIRQYLNQALPETTGLPSGGLAAALGRPGPAESTHDALDDCRSILEALRHLRTQGRPIFALG
ncbi:3'-5' exonuclease [Actinoplanes sp. NPDC026619]|uniref:3'-5' exonuclease n=1 Tax=Actinoplanes sp. NPDC026619 TaxID=3155798 RepID=UPI0033C410C4